MRFWNSSAPTFLDREAVIEEYRKLAIRAAGVDCRIRQVVLFGSLATGRATTRSDADLLIVLIEHPDPPIDRIPEYLEALAGAPTPVDVFPLTEAEIERRRRKGDRFLDRVLSEGIRLLDGPSR